MSVALLVIAGFCTLGAMFTIARTGQPRKPLTPEEVVWITVINAACITVFVLAALKIGLP